MAIVGDGPAGAALAAACADLGLRVVLHGTGEPWHATYATWRDDVAHLPDSVFQTITDRVVAVGARRHLIERPYAVFDNVALRTHLLDTHLLDGVEQITGRVDPADVDADVVVDATGATTEGPAATAWQTAFGVVLANLPPGSADVDVVTLMDWTTPSAGWPAADVDAAAVPSFCYTVPVRDGWLIEETVLAASPVVPPDDLRNRLIARLGDDGAALVGGALRVEEVWIPMSTPATSASGGIVHFGASAGFVHPATGYSVASSLRAAPRVAHAIATGGDVGAAVWPRSHRRARVLHEYGLDALLGLDATATADFFDAFFDLPVELWSEYLRIDTTPRAVAAVMRRVFRSAPWGVRRRLLATNPSALRRLLAAS